VGWQLAHEYKADNHYILEFVPKEQRIDAWSEMITVQAFFGLSLDRITPKAFLSGLRAKMEQRCPATFVYEDSGPLRPESTAAHSAIIGCGSAPRDESFGIRKGQGEVALFVAFSGKKDLFLVQRAHRGEAFHHNSPPINSQNVSTFIKDLEPIQLCEPRDQPSASSNDKCIIVEKP
jgi:hypothetical protein